uniref:Protein RALF-like 34 n=1 Tax=Ananas comosus var. bracteatus TaxID=296719 RepID=A0A6V7QWE7_ANACO
MAPLLLFLLFLCLPHNPLPFSHAQPSNPTFSTDPFPEPSIYAYPFGLDPEYELAHQVLDETPQRKEDNRRALFWHGAHHQYYISYAALSANRVPCPPRSGRSYYTHNCYRSRGPVHPYSRGCSEITRCRR